VVVEMLNTYLRHQAYIVKKYNGDIDKYVGDELVAVFQGPDMEENAVRCSVEIQQKMRLLTEERPEWNIAIGIGINTGDVVMGAMGSEDRMDYTILGDTVNLGARLCSAADRGRTIMSESTYEAVRHLDDLEIVALDPIQVKGKTAPIQIYEAKGSKSAYAGDGAGASEAVA
jgi:adenylate cyclase